MNDLEIQMIELYGKVDPRNRPYATFRMSTETLRILDRTGRPAVFPARTFGIPIKTDDSLPLDTIMLDVDTPFDRSLRRAREAGNNITAVKIQYPEPMPVPVPTLRALLRHWRKKVLGR